MKLQDKLEEIKQMGNYAVSFYYGEDIGADDMNIPQGERNIKIIFSPVGYLGKTRIMFIGTLDGALSFNFRTKPTLISNPPETKECENGGYFIWGTDQSVKRILDNPFHGKWEEEEDE